MPVDESIIEIIEKEARESGIGTGIGSIWRSNFENSNAEILSVISKSDREIRQDLIAQIYGDDVSESDWAKFGSIQPEEVSQFGRMLNWIRFGAGYIGNGAQGDQLSDQECLAMNFSYRCYWACGSNFMIRAVLGQYLSRESKSRSWPWPSAIRKQRDHQIQWLGHSIKIEMLKLQQFYEQEFLAQTGFLDAPSTKPALIDFQKVLKQINDADAAERGNR